MRRESSRDANILRNGFQAGMRQGNCYCLSILRCADTTVFTHVAEKFPLHVTPGLGLPFKLWRTGSEGGVSITKMNITKHCIKERIIEQAQKTRINPPKPSKKNPIDWRSLLLYR